MTSPNAPEEAWTVGQKRTLTGGTIEPCVRGYHASPTLWAALTYAPGPIACFVELSGKTVPHGDPIDKHAARSRKLIAAVNIDRKLRHFAADCAEHVLWIYEGDYPNDLRPRNAFQAARGFADGRIDAAARAAARAAAGAAARAAARAAAGDAADAAWDAAGDAAWDAAWAAAWAAARAAAGAARAAAWAAAWAAARAAAGAAADAAARAAGDAEQKWQEQQFNQRFGSIFGGEA